jgi:hypothetical protein
MIFEIDFNQQHFSDDDFFLEVLGAKLVPTGAEKYPPFEKFEIELTNFEQLEEILRLVDLKYNVISTAMVSFDPPTIYLDF